MAGIIIAFIAGAALGGLLCWSWMETEAAEQWEREHEEVEVLLHTWEDDDD